MPLYLCNSPKGTISDEAKQKIAQDITRIHCAVTAAPAKFVHAFVLEDSQQLPLSGHQAFLFGSIRSGRTDEQKQRLVAEMTQSIAKHTGLPEDQIAAITGDTPARWVMEGGDIFPEPGEEEAWMANHEAKLAAEAG